MLTALGTTQVEALGWEADDAIGVLCAQAGIDERVDIVTGDRDLLQLVRDGAGAARIRVLMPIRGVGELAVFDSAAVQATYGVPPERYADFATLRGDPSDGLPGVKGIGEKTARTLVAKYPTLDALLGESITLPPRLQANIHAAQPYLLAMRDVVPIRTDVAVEVTDGERDDARLDDLGTRYHLRGPIARLRSALNTIDQA